MSVADTFAAWLALLPNGDDLADMLAKHAFAAGLYVEAPSGEKKAIRPLLSPLILDLDAQPTVSLGAAPAQRIAIVARDRDSQLGELHYYERRWSEHGRQVRITTPERITRDEQRVYADGTPVDLVYRHIFARRLDPLSPLAQLC